MATLSLSYTTQTTEIGVEGPSLNIGYSGPELTIDYYNPFELKVTIG